MRPLFSKDVPQTTVLIRTEALRGIRATATLSVLAVRGNVRMNQPLSNTWSETQCQR
jgi:hypothetical protein